MVPAHALIRRDGFEWLGDHTTTGAIILRLPYRPCSAPAIFMAPGPTLICKDLVA